MYRFTWRINCHSYLVLRSRAARLAGRGDSCASASMKELGCRWRFEKLPMFLAVLASKKFIGEWLECWKQSSIINDHTLETGLIFFLGVSWVQKINSWWPDDSRVCAKLNAFGQKPAKCCMTIHQIFFSVSYLDASLFCAHGQRCMLFAYWSNHASKLSIVRKCFRTWTRLITGKVNSWSALRLPEAFCWQKVEYRTVQVFVLKHVGKKTTYNIVILGVAGPGRPTTTDALFKSNLVHLVSRKLKVRLQSAPLLAQAAVASLTARSLAFSIYLATSKLPLLVHLKQNNRMLDCLS